MVVAKKLFAGCFKSIQSFFKMAPISFLFDANGPSVSNVNRGLKEISCDIEGVTGNY